MHKKDSDALRTFHSLHVEGYSDKYALVNKTWGT